MRIKWSEKTIIDSIVRTHGTGSSPFVSLVKRLISI